MTALSCGELKRESRFAEESLFPTLPRKSRRKARSSRPDKGKYKEDGTRQPLDVKTGDRVLFGKYSGSEIKIDGEELLIMREDEILGIIARAGAATSTRRAASSQFRDSAASFVSKSHSTFQQERR